MKIFRNEAMLVPLLGLVLCIAWTLFAGKDLNWDAQNYHYYLPFSLFHDRISQDFFAASVQSYLSPISFVPFYLMVNADWPSIAVSCALAAMHSINLWLLYLISRQLLPKEPLLIVCIAVLLGTATILFWSQVGSSFNDVIVSIPVLAAFWILNEPLKIATFRKAIAAAFLLGCASGMKLSVLPIEAALAIAWLIANRLEIRVSLLLKMSFSGAAGVLLTSGYWWFRIWREFGSPIFPLFNDVFKSPLFSSESAALNRFIPGEWLDIATLPFRFALPDAWTYTEAMAPDIRWLVLAFIVVFWCVKSVLSAKWRGNSGRRLLEMPILFIILATILWQKTSGNGRYAMPLFLLIGPIIVASLVEFTSVKFARVVVSVILLVQLGSQVVASESRWSEAEWRGRWFDVDFPDKLKETPYLFLTMNNNSASFLTSFAHPASSFINVEGQYPLWLRGGAGERIKEIMSRHKDAVRMIRWYESPTRSVPSNAWVARRNEELSRFGLRVDVTDCENIFLKKTTLENIRFLSCKLIADTGALSEYDARVAGIESIFDVIERRCGSLLKPKGGAIASANGVFSRFYMGTENTLFIDSARVTLAKYHSLQIIYLGQLNDWRAGRVPVEAQSACGIH